MQENNLQKPITLEDLGKFTEEVLLPAIGNMIDEKLEEKLEQKLEEKLEQKLEEKLGPIRQEIFSIKEDIKWIKERIGRIEKTNSEDIIALNDEIKTIKIKMAELENQVSLLKMSQNKD